MSFAAEYRSDAERLGDLLAKATNGSDPEGNNLTPEEEDELRDLWDSEGFTEIIGPYDHPERWLNAVPSHGATVPPFEPAPANDELPRLPPPPVMTWEEDEQGQPGQLNFPTLIPVPTVAERAFLILAREWQVEAGKTPKDHPVPRAVDERALACLLLAVEWGREFTSVARQKMKINRGVGEARGFAYWMDQLPWQLCLASDYCPHNSDAIRLLTANLDHDKSDIRCWMMELGWCVAPWLNPVEAAVRLLKNLADTIAWPLMAAGLAARLFDTPEGFFAFADFFTPPVHFEDQYKDRLKRVEERGILAMQTPLWQTEAVCRKEIERAGLGFRKAGTHKT